MIATALTLGTIGSFTALTTPPRQPLHSPLNSGADFVRGGGFVFDHGQEL